MARTPEINVRVNVLFGWRCTECGATGESSHYIGSQSDLEAHWLAAHGAPLPPYEEAPPEENFWDDRTHLEPEHEHAWQPNYGGGHVCVVCRAKRPTSEEQR